MLELLRDHDEFSRAAALYLKAGLLPEAADCLHYAGKHNEAAATLHQGSLFDQLVSYVKK